MASNETPLDEIQWRDPQRAATMFGVHSNSVLFYFAFSPFFDPTSNNAVITNQANYNPVFLDILSLRESFEAHLRNMRGTAYLVSDAPAEMAPGTGTGVWVIRKEFREKGGESERDVQVLASYFVVGDNVYMAPTLADVLAFRISNIATGLSKALPAADSVRKSAPAASGHVHAQTSAPELASTLSRDKLLLASKESMPLPDGQAAAAEAEAAEKPPSPSDGISEPPKKTAAAPSTVLDARTADISYAIHMQFGGEYMDENPITGQPGAFQLSSTGRKEKARLFPALVKGAEVNVDSKSNRDLAAIDTTISTGTSLRSPAALDRKDDRTAKSPKSPIGLTSKRRKKSKAGMTPTAG